MKKVRFAIIGIGNRGTRYAQSQTLFPDQMEVTAIADPRRIRLDSANKFLHLPEDRLFDSADALLAQPKLADVMVIATQDQQHRDHAIRAMEAGYDLLLEKPIAVDPRDVQAIQQTANRLGRRVIVCHVLRYTPFYREVKRLLDAGTVGRIMTIEAAEHVGYYHIAHSFVRGNWHNTAASSPMILAKCCHDMDLLLWLTGKHCQKVTSFGHLSYFTAENRPEGASERCTDGCPVENCPYNAPRFYLSRIPGWPANVLHPEPTEENIMEALRTTDYGKCVFRMDNDVVDHQVLNLQFSDGVTAVFTMDGFNSIQTRTLRIAGTEGEIWGDFDKDQLYWQRYGEAEHRIDLSATETKAGHGGGDTGIIRDVIRLMRGDDFDTSSITTIDRSAESHYVAFAAEESRLKGGELVHLDRFMESL